MSITTSTLGRYYIKLLPKRKHKLNILSYNKNDRRICKDHVTTNDALIFLFLQGSI